MRSFRFIAAVAAALPLWTALPAAADPDPAAHRFIVTKVVPAFNAGSAKAIGALCSDSAVVIDEFPPYQWGGAENGCATWFPAFGAFAKQIKLVPGKVTVAPGAITDRQGTRVYVSENARFGGTLAGKPVSEEGAWTFTLDKKGSSYTITSMSWGSTKHNGF